MNSINRLKENKKLHEIEMCYKQAVESGCDVNFLEAFDTRMCLFPLKQTQAFLDALELSPNQESTNERIKQWVNWLKVLSKEHPKDKHFEEWNKSIQMIESTVK